MSAANTNHFLSTPIRRVGVVCFMALCLLVSPGCGGGADHSEPDAPAEASADTLVEYTVRGRVTQLPGGPEHPAREFMVRHEAIPEFRSSMAPTSTKMGMMSMEMAFPLGEGVGLDGIGVGDAIELMFETAYDAETGRLKGYHVETIRTLPADTVLEIAGEGSHKIQLP